MEVLPNGLSSSRDIFNLMVDTALHKIPSEFYVKCIDEFLIKGHNKKECYQCLEAILTVLKE